MASIAELRAIALLDGKQFEAEVKKLGNTTERMSQGMSRLGGMIAGAFSVGAITAFGRKMLATADDMQTASKSFGISMESLIGLTNAMAATGLGHENLLMILGKLQAAQHDVTKGNKEMTEGLKALNISEDEFVTMAPDVMLERVARGFVSAGGSADAYNAVAALFGQRIGPQMIEVLQNINDEGLEKLRSGAAGAAEGINQLGDASDTLGKTWNGIVLATANFVGWLVAAKDASKDVGAAIGEWVGTKAGETYADVEERVKRVAGELGRRVGGGESGSLREAALGDTGMGGPTTTDTRTLFERIRDAIISSLAKLPPSYSSRTGDGAGADANSAALATRRENERIAANNKAGLEDAKRSDSLDRLMAQQDELAAGYARQAADLRAGKGIASPDRMDVDWLQRIGGIVGGVAGGDQAARVAERQERIQQSIADLARETNTKLERINVELQQLGGE